MIFIYLLFSHLSHAVIANLLTIWKPIPSFIMDKNTSKSAVTLLGKKFQPQILQCRLPIFAVDQVADLLTKHLEPTPFNCLLAYLKALNIQYSYISN